jgi:hypothetical protein
MKYTCDEEGGNSGDTDIHFVSMVIALRKHSKWVRECSLLTKFIATMEPHYARTSLEGQAFSHNYDLSIRDPRANRRTLFQPKPPVKASWHDNRCGKRLSSIYSQYLKTVELLYHSPIYRRQTDDQRI